MVVNFSRRVLNWLRRITAYMMSGQHVTAANNNSPIACWYKKPIESCRERAYSGVSGPDDVSSLSWKAASICIDVGTG